MPIPAVSRVARLVSREPAGEPVTPSSAFTAGRPLTITASGELAMNGSAHPVTVTLIARRNLPQLQATASIPVSFARWASASPAG